MSSSSRPASAARARIVRRRRPDLNCAALADVDRRVLAVLCEHRVVRQDQLQRLFPDIPSRTLRYRTRRLHDLGLVGRSRPYRELGSAPNHHWPTRRANCVMKGDPIPRGGERNRPNPLFLAHAAALTELYVTLAVGGPSVGLSLLDYRREGDTREPFTHLRKERALAGCGGPSRDCLRASGRRRSACGSHCDDLATALAYGYANRRSLRC